MLLRHPKDKRTFCKIHRIKGVQMGSCLTCPNNAVICEVKGCIGHHKENQRAHNVLTIEQIRHIVGQYMNSTNEKKAYLKKMVYEYFTIARKQVQRLFTQVHDSIDHFVFDDLIFEQDDRQLITLLVQEEYEKFSCDQIGSIIPKLIKSFDFEDGHFVHLRNYLITQKEKVIAKLDMSLLNLPQFRWKNPQDNAYRFYELYEETLKELNTKLLNLTHKPKKIRLKYSNSQIIQLMQALLYEGLSKFLLNKTIQGQKMQFVRLLGTLQNLKDVEAVQIYCVWDVDENQFQLAVVQALLQLPYLRTIAIYTGYTVTSTEYTQIFIVSCRSSSRIETIYRQKSTRNNGCFDNLSPYKQLQNLYMSDKKGIQLSMQKKTPTLENQSTRQSHSSLDKIQKKALSIKLTNTYKYKTKNQLIFKGNQQARQQTKKPVNTEEWPDSNKRRYLKSYQLPKISSPIKTKKEETAEYQNQINENLIEDEEMLAKKLSYTLQNASPAKKNKLMPIRNKIYLHAVRTKAGMNGRQAKINQDLAIIQQKFPHHIKLYCICDGHGLNGHLVSAFIKGALIKNLNGPLKKLHNPPEKEKLIEIILLAISTTNQQLLDCDINTQLAGSTFVAVFIYGQKILTFNIGDSRAILLRQQKCEDIVDHSSQTNLPQLSHIKTKQQFQWAVIPLSIDQKPERPDEKQRIMKFGGRVFAQTNQLGQQLGPPRVWMKDIMMPGLAMSRSMGDKAGIKAGTNAQPEMIQHQIQSSDKFILIASDGVWQYLQNEQVVKIIAPFLKKNDINLAADALLKKSIDIWSKMNFSRDDITFILLKLNEAEE